MAGEIAGVMVVPLIVGLVEVAKRLGLPRGWAPAVAVGLGLAIALGGEALGLAGAAAWRDAAVTGLALGLSAAGLYSGARAIQAEVRTARGTEGPARLS